jgi:hypothetical protein
VLYCDDICIALKNDIGRYKIKKVTLFNIKEAFSELGLCELKIRKSKDIIISMKCPICGEYHSYSFYIKDLFRRDMIIGGCELTGIPVFYIGKEKAVMERVTRFIEFSQKAYALIGAKC